MSKTLYAGEQRLIIEPVEKEETKTDSGIILSSSAAGITYMLAKVISVGYGVNFVEKDDTVAIKSGVGYAFKFEGSDYKIIGPGDIWAVLRD
jgi:co-chaperonin GroES (HSP10)